jgi:hypothetical protein
MSNTIPDSPDTKEVILDLINAPVQAPPITHEDSVSDASLPLESQSSISATAPPEPASQEPENEPIPDLKHTSRPDNPGDIALETDRMLALDSSATSTGAPPPPPLRRSQRRSGKAPGE